jgi:hypothetical protein
MEAAMRGKYDMFGGALLVIEVEDTCRRQSSLAGSRQSHRSGCMAANDHEFSAAVWAEAGEDFEFETGGNR